MRTDAQQGILLNIVVGIVGAFIAGLIFGGGNINSGNPLDITNILLSLVGAVILLGDRQPDPSRFGPLSGHATRNQGRADDQSARPFFCSIEARSSCAP